jgi:hypothetical protein
MRSSVEHPRAAARDQLQDLEYVAMEIILSPTMLELLRMQQAAAGPAPAFLDDVPHEDPAPNGRASEVLRKLALFYLNDPKDLAMPMK